MPSLPGAPFDAVVFDLDGTLADSEGLHLRATQEQLANLDSSLSEVDYAGMAGMRVEDFVRALAPIVGHPPEALHAGREEIFWRLVRAELTAMPGAQAALQLLTDAGVELALATSGTRAYVQHVLEALELRSYFAAVVCGEDVVHGKPDPETYQLALRRLGRPAQRCAAVEDTARGVASAAGAGLTVLALAPAAAAAAPAGAAAVVPDLLSAARLALGGEVGDGGR